MCTVSHTRAVFNLWDVDLFDWQLSRIIMSCQFVAKLSWKTRDISGFCTHHLGRESPMRLVYSHIYEIDVRYEWLSIYILLMRGRFVCCLTVEIHLSRVMLISFMDKCHDMSSYVMLISVMILSSSLLYNLFYLACVLSTAQLFIIYNGFLNRREYFSMSYLYIT